MKSWIAAAVIIVANVGCLSEEEAPPRRAATPGVQVDVEDTEDDWACDEGDMRDCKVQIDEDNCFVGVEYCEGGEWTVCDDPKDIEEADGELQ